MLRRQLIIQEGVMAKSLPRLLGRAVTINLVGSIVVYGVGLVAYCAFREMKKDYDMEDVLKDMTKV